MQPVQVIAPFRRVPILVPIVQYDAPDQNDSFIIFSLFSIILVPGNVKLMKEKGEKIQGNDGGKARI